MGVGAQAQEVEQVVQVHLPVPLGVDIGGQVHPGQFPRQPLLALLRQHRLIVVIGAAGIGFQHFQHAGRFFARQHLAPALIVDRALRGQVFGCRNVELAVQDRIAGRVFVDVGGAVPDPLAGDKDRQLHMQLDFAHLEGRRMPVPHQIADQTFVIADMFGARAIGHARGLHDGGVIAHIVDHADKAVIQHLMCAIQMRLHPLGHGAQGGARGGAGCLDFGKLVGGKRHQSLRWVKIWGLLTLSIREMGVCGQAPPPELSPVLITPRPPRLSLGAPGR